MLVFEISVFFQRYRFFGFCDTLPTAALNRFFRMLLRLAMKEIRTESTVAAETIKLIGNSSSGNQIKDYNRHTNTKYVKGSHVDKFVNNRFLRSLNELPEYIYSVEMSNTFLFYHPARERCKKQAAFEKRLPGLLTKNFWLRFFR